MRRCKSFDQPPEPHRILNKQPAVSGEVLADLGEKNGKIACRGRELLFWIFEFCLEVGRIGQDKVELALDAGEHVALLDRDIAYPVTLAVLNGVLHRGRTDIDGQ